jgi:hypothetical protein
LTGLDSEDSGAEALCVHGWPSSSAAFRWLITRNIRAGGPPVSATIVTEDAMVASIWLQLSGEEQGILRDLIASMAAQHGTMPFEPHLTVCTIADPPPAAGDAAAEYIKRCRSLPLTVRKAGISTSTTVPFRAVVIDLENSPEILAFRENLRQETGANELVPPHISLLYTIDANQQRTSWSGDETRLRDIADECAARLSASRFVLDRPILVMPEGDWSNIRSWKVLRSF